MFLLVTLRLFIPSPSAPPLEGRSLRLNEPCSFANFTKTFKIIKRDGHTLVRENSFRVNEKWIVDLFSFFFFLARFLFSLASDRLRPFVVSCVYVSIIAAAPAVAASSKTQTKVKTRKRLKTCPCITLPAPPHPTPSSHASHRRNDIMLYSIHWME